MSKTEDKDEILKETVHTKKPMFSVFKDAIVNDKIYFYFLIVILIYYFSLYISVPYNKFYLLNIIKLSYAQYLILEIIAIIGVIVSLFYWGKTCDKFGATKTLKATMIFLPLYPLALIFFPHNLTILAILIFIDAVITAGLGLSITTYLYQNIKQNLITHYTFFLVFQAVALTIGALLGALINKVATGYLGTEAKGLVIVFSVGVFFRIITAIFTSKIKDKRPPKKGDTDIIKEIITFRPVAYGVTELSKLFNKHQMRLTHNVGRTTIHLHKNLHKTAKQIIKTTRKAIQKTKTLLDK
jgi:MFS family permease